LNFTGETAVLYFFKFDPFDASLAVRVLIEKNLMEKKFNRNILNELDLVKHFSIILIKN
jgi:hypothetical protein